MRPFSLQLGVYDLDRFQWKSIDDADAQDAFFQSFGWGNVYPYFVFGQHGRLFHAGKINEQKLYFNFTLDNEQESLAPFATDGELFLYMIEQVTEEEFFKKVVTISSDGELKTIANLDGMPVMDGVIAGNYLYFTCPVMDTDAFEVWSIDLTKNDPHQQTTLVREDYHSFKIYQYKGNVLFLDFEKQLLFNDEVTINLSQKSDLIMIDDEVNILAEQYTKDMTLELSFTDISSGEILGTYPGAINFTREGSVITIYGDGFIEKLDLTKGE
jgi:hypothetical protein